MNKKVMWLMVGLVAAVLPAVAVADVMLTAYINGNETPVSDHFFVQQGSNYANANTLAGFTWTPQMSSESEILGSITLGYMSNETITEVNVLDVNFTSLTAPATFNITVTVPNGGSVFQADTYIYFSESPQTVTSPGESVSLSSATANTGVTVSFTVSAGSIIYIGFIVGSGGNGGGTFELDMALTEL